MTTSGPPGDTDGCRPGDRTPTATASAIARPFNQRTSGVIAYVAWEPGGADRSALWIMGGLGHDKQQLTESGGHNADPDVALGNRSIVWTHDSQVVTMDPNGTVRRLTDCGAVPAGESGTGAFDGPKRSYDGTMIAVAERVRCCTGRPAYRLVVMHADGTNRRPIALSTVPMWIDTGLSWLPGANGRKVVVHAQPSDTEAGGLFLIDIADGSSQRISTDDGASPDVTIWPSSSVPTGNTIVFIDRGSLVTMNTDGSHRRVVLTEADLPPNTHFVAGPVWAIERTDRIIFGCRMGDSHYTGPASSESAPEADQPDLELWSVLADGSDLRNLTGDSTLRQADPGT